MKRILLLISMSALLFTMTACSSGVKQEEYDSLKTTNQSLEKEKTAQNDTISSLNTKIGTLESEIEKINNEYTEYKEKMKPYAALSLAEAEAATAKIEKEKAEAKKAKAEAKKAKKEKEEKAKKDAAEKAAAQAAKGYETGITYEQLARTPDKYKGKKIKFTGTVVQVMEGDSEIQIRLAVNGDYDQIILCAYDPSIVESRILKDVKITVYGLSLGLLTYKSTIGGDITIPSAFLAKIE